MTIQEAISCGARCGHTNCPNCGCHVIQTPPETTWEERFDEVWTDAGEEYPNRKSRVKYLICAEKTKSYQEGLEKALEVLEGMKARDTDPLHSYMPQVVNGTLSEAKKKIKELIDQK